LIGIVSRADVLRAIAALPEVPEPGEGGAPKGGRSVGDAAIIEVPVVSPVAPAQEVLEKIVESRLRRVVVAGPDEKVLGLISDRDFLARSTPGTRPWVLRLLGAQRPAQQAVGGRSPVQGLETALTASDFMAPSLVTVRPEDSLAHAIRLMMQHGVKRLIVVDDAGRFRGLVDRREILRLLATRSGL
jgi:CBS domain-containing protein